LSGDLQSVESTSTGDDFTLGLVAFPDYIVVDNLNTKNGTPSIATPAGFLGDSSNFSYGQMMAIFSDNNADSKAARLDAEYEFEDSLVTSVKMGARYSEKSAINRDGNNWAANYQPWQVGTSWQPFASTSALPKIQNDLYVTSFSFEDFQRGDTNVPTSGVLIDSAYLADFDMITTNLIAASPGGASGSIDQNALDLTNPRNINTQDEETTAFYARVDFDLEPWSIPVGGNVGVRYVETENIAHGQLSYPTFQVQETNPDTQEVTTVQPFFSPEIAYDAKNSYSNFLPSLNLRWTPTDQTVVRFSAARGVWRPEFWRMKALLSLSAGFKEGIEQPDTIAQFDPSMVEFSLDSSGTNPYLEPMEADQFDITAEWYSEGGSFAYVGLFQKDVKDFFRTSTTRLEGLEGFSDIVSTLPINTGEADVDGFEVGATWFLDSVSPALDGFGIQANYTYIDSSTKVSLDTQPVDTNGALFGDMPLEGLSEKTTNIALMYEKHGWWARLAYNWRSEHLLAIGPNGFNGSTDGIDWRLPVFADDYGQLDLTFGYNFNEHVSINFEAYNIGQAETRGTYLQTSAGSRTAFVNTQDTRYGVSLRVTY
jgi:TonB-dependent receptor